MNYIECKDVFLLIRDTLKFIDPEIIEHGYRVAYMVYKMLEESGGYEKYELADIIILMTLHDLGAYKTEENLQDMVFYETKDALPHSIYGYLFCKHVSPREEGAPIILYHHVDYDKLPGDLKPAIRSLCGYLNIVDHVDIYHKILGERFDVSMFQKNSGTKYSAEGLELFRHTVQKHNILKKISDGRYKEEMDQILEYMIFSNEENKKYLEMLMYCLGYKNECMVVDTITRICIGRAIARKLILTSREEEILYYGALLCDVGMLAIPSDIIDAPRKLTDTEKRRLMTHVILAEEAMKQRMHQEVIALISCHHERGDGSGYPRKMKDFQMSRPQRILQVADVMAALLNDRSYRKRKEKEEVIAILQEEKQRGRLNKDIVDTVITFYDEIYTATRTAEQEVLATYNKLVANYEIVKKQFDSTKVNEG